MDLETARRHISSALERMRACYLQAVFDEWLDFFGSFHRLKAIILE